MQDRIGALHLHYRVGRGSLGAALAPGFDRAIRAGLADALGARISAMLGDDPAVVVIRELKAPVVIKKDDWSLDSRVVARICAASADSAAALLSRDAPTDAVMRFADEVEFVGSFIVELIAGSAWGHWYYGAFHRYRCADAAATIRAVLAESGVEAARVFAWLSRRGQLSAIFSVLAPHDARRLVAGGGEGADGANSDAVLVDAAMRLLAQMGVMSAEPRGRQDLVAQFLATRPIAPDWTDRRSLSAWVLEFIRFAVGRPARAAPVLEPANVEAVHALLTGPLDWLDAPWLASQLTALSHGPAGKSIRTPTAHRPLLTPRHDRILQGIARRLRAGRIRLADDSEDALVVCLVAAASEEASSDDRLDRTLVAAIELVARAYFSLAGSGDPPGQAFSRVGEIDPAAAAEPARYEAEAARRLAALRTAGNSARELLRAAVETRAAPEEEGAPAPGAGVFLLVRAVLDTRLAALARQFGVPLEPLLGGLAIKWLGVPLPFDRAISLWAGTEHPRLADLDAAGENLCLLNAALLDVLVDRKILDAPTAGDVIAADAALLTRELACSAQANAAVAGTASSLLRAWGRWLPGLRDSSSPFLLENCVRRAGRVLGSAGRIAVQLDPAPLDVVLQMAGYLAPVERVAWLGDRTVTFAVRRGANADVP
jgi:hypothetical protein